MGKIMGLTWEHLIFVAGVLNSGSRPTYASAWFSNLQFIQYVQKSRVPTHFPGEVQQLMSPDILIDVRKMLRFGMGPRVKMPNPSQISILFDANVSTFCCHFAHLHKVQR